MSRRRLDSFGRYRCHAPVVKCQEGGEDPQDDQRSPRRMDLHAVREVHHQPAGAVEAEADSARTKINTACDQC